MCKQTWLSNADPMARAVPGQMLDAGMAAVLSKSADTFRAMGIEIAD
jgi:hypothetical protein